MAKYNQSDFADKCGVTKQAITKAIIAGNVVIKDKLIDEDLKQNHDYLYSYRKHRKKSDEQRAVRGEQVEGLESLDVLNRKHKAEQIRKLELETQTKRGELIPRSLVEKVFSKLHMIDQTEFLNLGQNLAPGIMAIGKIKDETKELEIKAAIDSAIYRCLDTVKKEIDKFLEQTAHAQEISDER